MWDLDLVYRKVPFKTYFVVIMFFLHWLIVVLKIIFQMELFTCFCFLDFGEHRGCRCRFRPIGLRASPLLVPEKLWVESEDRIADVENEQQQQNHAHEGPEVLRMFLWNFWERNAAQEEIESDQRTVCNVDGLVRLSSVWGESDEPDVCEFDQKQQDGLGDPRIQDRDQE